MSADGQPARGRTRIWTDSTKEKKQERSFGKI